VRPAGVQEDAPDAALRTELAALDEAAARGDIDAEGAESAKAEAQRRFLRVESAKPAPGGTSAPSALAAALAAAVVIVGAGGLYALLRNPDEPIAADAPAAEGQQELEGAIAQIKERLRQNPDDAEGWRVLGWAEFIAGRLDASEDAYLRAIQLAPDNAAYRSGLGETLTAAADGTVVPDAKKSFEAALARDPKDLRARFYLGLAKAQAGNPRGAIDDWFVLYGEAPADSDASQELRQRIETLAKENKIDVSDKFPAERGPSAADVEAAAGMSDEERSAMIEGMVERLDARLRANPRDLEGWMQLINARFVQGKAAEAQDAIRRAREVFKNDPDALRQLEQAEAAVATP
jgi:cytochrome c-type biogenesis protein CcmH